MMSVFSQEGGAGEELAGRNGLHGRVWQACDAGCKLLGSLISCVICTFVKYVSQKELVCYTTLFSRFF